MTYQDMVEAIFTGLAVPEAKRSTHGPWWDTGRSPPMGDAFHRSWATSELCLQAIRGGPPVTTYALSAHLQEGESLEDFYSRFESSFPDLRLVKVESSATSAHSERIYGSASGLVAITHGDSAISISYTLNSATTVEQIRTFFAANTTAVLPRSRVNVLVSTADGPEFRSIGVGGSPLERGNYSQLVLDGYDRVVQDLNSRDPNGRVAIFTGAPGTGKTFLIRGILDEVLDATLAVIPSALVVQLANPSLLPLLLSLHEERGGKALVFLIEDADECLAPRMADNMSSVSALLNLGDGILGKILDVRIVATTNAHQAELDSAIVRPGRLSAAVNVGPLDPQKAEAIFRRLAPGKEFPGWDEDCRDRTLAEVYQMARDEGWRPAPKSSGVGFRSLPSPY